MLLSELDELTRLLVSSSLRSIFEAKAFLRGTSTGRAGGFPIQKDECSYSFSNAIRTLAMVREAGLEPARA